MVRAGAAEAMEPEVVVSWLPLLAGVGRAAMADGIAVGAEAAVALTRARRQ